MNTGEAGSFSIRPATPDDAALILELITELADYERLRHEVEVTADAIRESLFGERRVAEAVIGECDGAGVAFALFFHNFSTFLGRPGLYLEDLYVRPEFRGRGFGRNLLAHLAQLARERGCGRFEWSVLDWNEPAIRTYKGIGAAPLNEWTVYRLTGDALDKLAEGGG